MFLKKFFKLSLLLITFYMHFSEVFSVGYIVSNQTDPNNPVRRALEKLNVLRGCCTLQEKLDRLHIKNPTQEQLECLNNSQATFIGVPLLEKQQWQFKDGRRVQMAYVYPLEKYFLDMNCYNRWQLCDEHKPYLCTDKCFNWHICEVLSALILLKQAGELSRMQVFPVEPIEKPKYVYSRIGFYRNDNQRELSTDSDLSFYAQKLLQGYYSFDIKRMQDLIIDKHHQECITMQHKKQKQQPTLFDDLGNMQHAMNAGGVWRLIKNN